MSEVEPVRSFCSHVIHLCDYLSEVNILADLTVIQQKAAAVKAEAMGVQDVYGGRPRGKERGGK